jgi:hypothetical protein
MASVFDFNELKAPAEKIAMHSINSVLAQQVRHFSELVLCKRPLVRLLGPLSVAGHYNKF